MENEENKKGCCEGKEKCEHGMNHCCHNWKKCHMMKWVLVIIALIIAFCLGSQWGQEKGEWRGDRFDRGGMMNWGGNKFDNTYSGASQKAVGEVTVDVSNSPVTPVQ